MCVSHVCQPCGHTHTSEYLRLAPCTLEAGRCACASCASDCGGAHVADQVWPLQMTLVCRYKASLLSLAHRPGLARRWSITQTLIYGLIHGLKSWELSDCLEGVLGIFTLVHHVAMLYNCKYTKNTLTTCVGMLLDLQIAYQGFVLCLRFLALQARPDLPEPLSGCHV